MGLEEQKIVYGQDQLLNKRLLLGWAREEDGSWKKEFSDWFKGSWFTDSTGAPLIFYHGTYDNTHAQDRANFSELSSQHISQIGFHFGSSHAANRIVTQNHPITNIREMPDNDIQLRDGKDHKIFPVILAMKNPLYIKDVETFSENLPDFREAVLESILARKCQGLKGKKREYVEREVARIWNKYINPDILETWDAENVEETLSGEDGAQTRLELIPGAITKIIEELGFDGFVYANKTEEENGEHSVIALHPLQVRSALTGEYIWKE